MLNPAWAKPDPIYVALLIDSKVVAILKPTRNGYVYGWHYNKNHPQYVVPVNPNVNPHVQYVLMGQNQAADLVWSI